MAASITFAGESLIARKQSANLPLNITHFIFANVTGLDTAGAVDRASLRPPADQVVYSVTIPSWAAGYVNPNQVVYSAQIGSDIGDWDYNWIGLESDEGVLFAVSYVPLQQKRRNIPPLQTGNNITRNFLVAFDGAQAITGLTIDASTWQHDFTVRLVGIDQRERLSNRDIYGRSAYFGDAMRMEKVSGAYRVAPGIAYGEGIRVASASSVIVNPPSFPTTAYMDCALERQLNDVVATWKVVFDTDLIDYYDGGAVQHYVVPIAHLPNANTIIDMRDGVRGTESIASQGEQRAWLYFISQI